MFGITISKMTEIYDLQLDSWSQREIAKKDKLMMVEIDYKNADGSTTKMLSIYDYKASRDRIDGHFWIEDLNGKILSDCGFGDYKHNLPIFQNPSYWNSATDFIVYQPVPCPVMEQEIIERQVESIKSSWGRELNQIVSCFEDERTTDERFKAVARQMWKDRANMLGAYECRQHAVCEHLYLTEMGVECRIRFGCAGIVRPRDDEVYWFFGHLENTEYGEWIVKDAVTADGIKEKDVIHTRRMSISKVPNAKKAMDERETKKQIFNALKEITLKRKRDEEEIVRKREGEAHDRRAEKALAELLAEEEEEEKKSKKQKKSKKSKK